MTEFLNLAFIALGTFAFVVTGIALFISIPQNKLDMPQARIARGFTSGYRQGGFKKLLYIAFPFAVFLFSSVLGGLFLMGAALMGARFSKLESAMQAKLEPVPQAG